jgi:hypothetical protein
MKASETGDVNTVLNLMADDVIFTVPGLNRSANMYSALLWK